MFLIIVAVVIVGWLMLRANEKANKKSNAEFWDGLHAQHAKNRQASEAASAFVGEVQSLALGLRIVAPAWTGMQVTRAELAQSIDDFARRAARGGWATSFAGMAECIATADAVVIYSKSNVLRWQQRERPSELGAVERKYVRTGNDMWAFEEVGLRASEVDQAIARAMQGQFTRVLSATP